MTNSPVSSNFPRLPEPMVFRRARSLLREDTESQDTEIQDTEIQSADRSGTLWSPAARLIPTCKVETGAFETGEARLGES